MSLAARQQALVEALLGRGEAKGLAVLPAVADGFKAYRGNAQGLAAKVLGGHFPVLVEALGEPQFAAMAWAFWRAGPPRGGDLADWGAALPEFLAAQPGMDEALVQAARVDWARHEAERAVDGVFDADSLGLLAGEAPVALRFRPGTVLVGEVLVWRQGWRAVHRRLISDEAALLRPLLAGRSLATALAQAPEADFAAFLQTALREGWLLGALTLEKD